MGGRDDHGALAVDVRRTRRVPVATLAAAPPLRRMLARAMQFLINSEGEMK